MHASSSLRIIGMFPCGWSLSHSLINDHIACKYVLRFAAPQHSLTSRTLLCPESCDGFYGSAVASSWHTQRDVFTHIPSWSDKSTCHSVGVCLFHRAENFHRRYMATSSEAVKLQERYDCFYFHLYTLRYVSIYVIVLHPRVTSFTP
jgi:hypothetical protein